jgi:phenylpropionate dioxygenase-like ring-hydroxylating dioxygenase large terminal subunit
MEETLMQREGASSHPDGGMQAYVDDRPGDGIFRVHRDVYADQALFELENRYIFERTWNFLGFDSQLPAAHDFITAHIGMAPILVTRGADMQVRAFLNICRHKGATLAACMQGNAKVHACPYHGWVFDSGGRNIYIKERDNGAYTAGFDAEDHDLRPLGRVESYKGLIFGSMSPDVPSLNDYLGDTRFFIDLAMDQDSQGMEVIPGRAVYTYRG